MFPSNPIDGQNYKNYKYNSSISAWKTDQWRPWLNFGDNTRFGKGLNSLTESTNAKVITDASSFNSSNYTPNSEYLTWYISGSTKANMEFNFPPNCTQYMIRFGATSSTTTLYEYVNSSWVSVDAVTQSGGENLPELHTGSVRNIPSSRKIKLTESSVASVWWIFIK